MGRTMMGFVAGSMIGIAAGMLMGPVMDTDNMRRTMKKGRKVARRTMRMINNWM